MRTSKLLPILAFTILFWNMGEAHHSPDPVSEIQREITKLLGNPHWTGLKEDLSATVYFTVNIEQEVVVLYVDTSDERAEAYIKNRMNYQRLKDESLVKGRTYSLPVRILASR